MQKHTKIYFDFFEIDYDPVSGWHNCRSEISGLPAQDIHHVERRGMGGSKSADRIENLMALTREEHINFGDKEQYKDWLQNIHDEYMLKFKKNNK